MRETQRTAVLGAALLALALAGAASAATARVRCRVEPGRLRIQVDGQDLAVGTYAARVKNARTGAVVKTEAGRTRTVTLAPDDVDLDSDSTADANDLDGYVPASFARAGDTVRASGVESSNGVVVAAASATCVAKWRSWPSGARRDRERDPDEPAEGAAPPRARHRRRGRRGGARRALPRHQGRVAAWYLGLCGRREEAADLAQEVLLRVQQRLGGFRFESRFSTWLYLVVRSVAIHRGRFEARRRALSLEEEGAPEPLDPAPGPDDELVDRERPERLRAAIAASLDPLEAQVLKLHHVDGLTLAAIDALLGLTDRSGAKAYLVSATRKLKRRLAEEER
jgi:RNA polymerase sigma-70 factor (ECF subfamily)